MCSAIRRASSATTSRATASPARAAPKTARGSKGAASAVSAAPRREPRGSAETAPGARVDLLAARADQVELARRAVAAAVQLAAQHEPGAEAGADREEDEVLDAPGDAEPLLADRREVDVVLERHRESEPRLELGAEGQALEAGDVGGQLDPVAVGGATTPGTPTTRGRAAAGRPLAATSASRSSATPSIAARRRRRPASSTS